MTREELWEMKRKISLQLSRPFDIGHPTQGSAERNLRDKLLEELNEIGSILMSGEGA